jgi:hypothetical protein
VVSFQDVQENNRSSVGEIMDTFLKILKAIASVLPYVKKLFPKQASKLPEKIKMSESVWDK